jgi:CheY-like chemotaxis protein/TolB-like protein
VARSRSAAVLVVEDESIVAHDLQQTLSGLGYDAFGIAASADEALARASERRPDIALVDVRIKGKTDGIKAAQALQERFGVPVVYLTAHADDATLERAKQTRPYGYLLKPVKPAELKSAIEIALFRYQTDKPAPAGSTPPRGVSAPAAARAGRAPGARLVRREVERILASGDFDASPRSKDFLRFIVEETLAARCDEVTQTAIATRVFQRRDDFDATVDPIVRIQAGRLRRSLERYYLLAGKQDPVRIELPRGTYIPVFSSNDEVERASAAEPAPPVEARRHPVVDEDWPTVVIRPFEPAQPGPEHEATAARVTEQLLLELGRYRDVKTLLQPQLDQLEPARRDGVRFALGGRLQVQDGARRVTAQLVDRATGEQIWGDEYHTASAPGRWSGTPDDIARVIAARVGAEEGVLVQLLATERRKRRGGGPVTTYGAMLLSYEFFLARDPASLSAAVEALKRTVKAEPDCGLAWTRLARLYLANHSFEVTSVSTPLEEAITYAHHGVRVDPSSRWARCILGSSLLIRGELEAAKTEVEQSLRLSPDSLCYLEIIGFQLSLLGDERGPELIRSARQRNPHCLPHASFGLWFDHLRRGEIEPAYQAALEYRDPTFFWRCLMRASCLGLLERTDEAAAEVAELLRRKPNFEKRGRTLIDYYVKLDDVRDRVVEGLSRAGLKLADPHSPASRPSRGRSG